MNARIKELESALAAARVSASTDATEESDGREPDCKYSIRRRAYGDGRGTLAMDEEGLSSYHGEMAHSEYLSDLIPGDGLSTIYQPPDIQDMGLPREMIQLFNAFPFGMRERVYNKLLFLPFIPSKERALQLTNYHYERFAWMCNGVAKEDFQKEILPRVYGASDVPTVDHIHPHRLSVFFGVMAIGASLSFEPNACPQAGKYYILACSALSLAPLISEAMVPTIQALFLINAFLHSNNRASAEESWLLTGLSGRLILRTGLHRDGAQFKLDKDEIQRRRLLFWEIYLWDAWFSFVTGRAPSIHLPDTDTRFAEDFCDSGVSGFQAYKHRFTAACLWPAVRLSCAKEVSYQAIMNLDKKIRTFPIPVDLQSPMPWPRESELNLLFIHRNYLAVALRAEPRNPVAHKFGGSVLAVFRSVLRLCSGLKDVYQLHPAVTSRVWFFWSGIFSACIALAAIVIVSPMCDLAETALKELRAASELFERGSAQCRHPKSLYLLNNLLRQAESNYETYMKDPANFPEVESRVPSTPDELMILGGVVHGVIPHPTVPEPASPIIQQSPVSDIRTQPDVRMHDRSFPEQQPTYSAGISYGGAPVPASTNPAYIDAIFGANDFTFQSSSSALPSYDDIMDVNDVGAALGPYQSYSSFLQTVNAPLTHVAPSRSPSHPLHAFGQYQQAVPNPNMMPGEGGSHDDMWRSFIGGLTNGQVNTGVSFVGDYFF
ncbi:hypothetical protein NM688_g8044 [Phlebia brevispora]|uniref:Uncharacterized protein n=1 Tax=Phlebia brevispora TaxID=194682 RepID=A0ACC1RYK9_9APHY|nr:hypothetical protein NM688_g8044 [Phlebia brevispora]